MYQNYTQRTEAKQTPIKRYKLFKWPSFTIGLKLSGKHLIPTKKWLPADKMTTKGHCFGLFLLQGCDLAEVYNHILKLHFHSWNYPNKP